MTSQCDLLFTDVDLVMGPKDDLSSMTFLRAFRLLRLFKANEYVQCMDRYVRIGSSCMPVFKLTLMIVRFPSHFRRPLHVFVACQSVHWLTICSACRR